MIHFSLIGLVLLPLREAWVLQGVLDFLSLNDISSHNSALSVHASRDAIMPAF